MTQPLTAPLDLFFDYQRSTGPAIGAFVTAVRDGRLLGGRTADRRVVVPPPEYDPATGDPITDFVDVGPAGTVLSYSWQAEPQPEHPLETPFAWVLVQLDGADTPLLHVLQAEASELEVGMRVQARWADERAGRITDLVFVPEGAAADPAPAEADEPVSMINTPIALSIQHSASHQESEYLRGLARGELIGARVGPGSPVYIPPRGASPTDGVPTEDFVHVSDTGTVTTFCIVNVPFLGQQITPPYVSAYILLDGADIAIQHLILECPADEVRMGMRVQAKWRPESEWGHTLRNIEYFRPTGEPDADYETYRHHL
ncbi:Zn-ribbon domain-containing OB-fold protein [Enemella sp. A6]|uniref:Zn-ribbon domain-containing OB-fold protein n=1 Tax=Enemella sp. A6 TaxID=3440152 RepID=UPI003EB95621